jgi:hypothetical protein
MKVILLTCLLLTGCTKPHEAYRVLTTSGYTNIYVGGYSYFMCGRDDWFRTRFTAIGVNGQPVSGAVCGGVFKGYTVRLE